MNKEFDKQFEISQRKYISDLDFFTWTRHFYLIRDLIKNVSGDIFEVGTGDGVVRRSVKPFVKTYTVLDLNSELNPDIHGDLRVFRKELIEKFDAALATEVLEHIPFADFNLCVNNLHSYLKPGGKLFLTLPHRKGHMLIVTPKQRMIRWRFPIGMTSLSEAYNRFVRRKIWIDPNHHWEIGDGIIGEKNIEIILKEKYLIESFIKLPYCDYWILQKK